MRFAFHADAVKLRVMFALAGTVLLGAVGWGGWQLVDQDRALGAERQRERLEAAASVVCASLDRALGEWEDSLATVSAGSNALAPPGAVIVLFEPSAVVWLAGVQLPYLPAVTAPRTPPGPVFAEAEAAEFRERNPRKAAALYRVAAEQGDAAWRPEAQMRLARNLRHDGRAEQALAAYERLATFGAAPAGGSPAALTARRERVAIFEAAGNHEAARREAGLLAADLDAGRYPIDRATYEFFRESALASARDSAVLERLSLAEALTAVWEQPRETGNGLRATQVLGGQTGFVVLRRQAPAGVEVLVGPASALAASIAPRATAFNVAVQVVDERGQTVFGHLPPSSVELGKLPADTGLPWTVRLVSADPAAEQAAGAWRSRQLLSGLAVVLLVLAGAGYAGFRAVDREIAVARLQSDFVAAVSHEFRTPLAAMSHITESLEEGRVSEERRPVYYRTLARENRRLRAMVENLLDFARMEADRHAYRMEPVPVAALVREVVESARDHLPDNGRVIELELPADECLVAGDREALVRAARNLLDNAVKYSPASAPVKVAVSVADGFVSVSVADSGSGIPKSEHERIFRKFVRGASARSLNVKGTGIGLAMVRHIVDGHGGRTVVDSEPGRGSRFVIVLPATGAGGAGGQPEGS